MKNKSLRLDVEDELDGSILFEYDEITDKIIVSMFEDYHFVGEFKELQPDKLFEFVDKVVRDRMISEAWKLI
jgi:hypothetical protein